MGGISSIGAAVANPDYTSARAAKLDFLDASILSRLGSVVVQTGYAHTFGGSTSGEDGTYEDVTISAAVVANSIVIIQGLTGAGSGISCGFTGRLTSTTNLRISAASGATGPTCRWYVIEIK